MDMRDFSPQVRGLWALASPCTLCPRQCRAERSKGQIGLCGIAGMPDMKYADSQVADELSAAPDYPEVNQAGVKEMHRQVGDLQIEKGFTAEIAEPARKKQRIISACPAVSAVKVEGLATRGLLVRHLVLPNNLAGSFEIIDFLADQVSPSTTINVMDQYRPCYKASAHPKINRRPTQKEIASVRQYALQKGLNVLV